jgi:hypothetical protein
MLKPPTISLCMISLNDAQMIGDCLRSCAGVVDEMIVIDHGSTDGTQQIARDLGAKVFERKWTDSYAEARNASFAQASGDWVFVLCADERLEPESAKNFRQTVAEATTEGLTVLLIDESPGGESMSRYLRLAQRADLPPMVRRIHEIPARPPKSVADTPIRIRHLGHKRGPNAEKLRHYQRLLELQLTETPADHYLLVDLLHTYWILKDPRWASTMEKASAELDRSDRPKHPLVAVLLELAMLRPAGTAPRALSADQAAELAERWYPTYLPLLALRIRQALARKDHAAVMRLATPVFQQVNTTNVDPLPCKRGYLEADIHLLTGAACVMAGQREKAIEHFRIAAKHPDIAKIANSNLKNLGINQT